MVETDLQNADDPSAQIAPVPRVSIQAFCESPEIAAVIQEAMGDRRMAKAHVKVHMGGAFAAVEAYRSAPTPNVIVLESSMDREALLEHLDALSNYCDAGTKVIVAGRVNDITLYRDLIARGVSEYVVAPFDILDFIRIISELYTVPGADPVGRIVAVIGAKGGVGASMIAHNIAWSIARELDIATVVADMDLGFGTAGLDFNQDPPQGIAEAVFAPDRIDSNLVDRLLSKCSEKLSILAAPATLDRVYDFTETSFDGVVDALRGSVPAIVLDIPHLWTAWTRRMLIGADDVVIVATPDLASLRNTKNMVDTLRTARPNDTLPKLVMNCVGMPKRPEIAVADFCKAVELEATATIAFDPKLFGIAANNGQMIAEVESSSKIAETFCDLARLVTGRGEARKAKRTIFDPFVTRFRKKAS
ncbi:MAG TPA: CpaE family protein [Beijerinckiaceae bacterium]|nr:CpaE family protein [Beijerinckiaceae bacterium]